MSKTVATVTPTIPPRRELLLRAMKSVFRQTRKPDQVVVEPDPHGTGSAATRNRANARVVTDYIAVLDDDDELLPNHLETLMQAAEEHPEADVLYPIPRVEGSSYGEDFVVVNGEPVSPWGLEWTEDHRQHLLNRGNFIYHTCLMKTRAVRDIGGYPKSGISLADDHNLFYKLALRGYVFRHVPEETWVYRKNPLGHTGGLPDSWI